MLIFTIGIIIWWVLSVLSMEMVRFTNTKKNEGKVKAEETTVAGCMFLILGIPYVLGYLIYLLFALKIDPYLYPTYFMIGVYILEFLLSMLILLFTRITGKKRKLKEKTSIRSYLTRFLTLVYFGYMLWAVIN